MKPDNKIKFLSYKGDRNSEVFDWPQDFYDHHSKTKDNLMIVGNRIKII